METNNLEPPCLLTRMSSPPLNQPLQSSHLDPPELLHQLSPLKLRMRKSGYLKELNKPGRVSEANKLPSSIRSRMLSMNLINGPMQLTRTETGPLTPTWLRSTPTLLARLRMNSPAAPSLLHCLSPWLLTRSGHDQEKMSPQITCFKLGMRKKRKSESMAESEHGKKICLGSHQISSPLGETLVSRPAELSNNLAKTSLVQSPSYKLPIISQKEYHPPNGIGYSEGSPLTSTRSSPCTLFNLMMRERAAWVTLKSCWQSPSPNAISKLGPSGQPPSRDLSK